LLQVPVPSANSRGGETLFPCKERQLSERKTSLSRSARLADHVCLLNLTFLLKDIRETLCAAITQGDLMCFVKTKLANPVMRIRSSLPIGFCLQHFGEGLSRLVQLSLIDVQH